MVHAVSQERREDNSPPLYTDGYYARRILKGDRPAHGYPTNHLPKPAKKRTATKPGYIALKKGK